MTYSYKGYSLPYTIFFCIVGTKVLLVKREKEPYLNMWNGLGGKIEERESPEESVKRELVEETGLDIAQARIIDGGIVTWDVGVITKQTGMFAFLFDFPESVLFDPRKTREGILEWKELDWIVERGKKEVAENIKYFLPEMIQNKTPLHYHCEYANKNDKHDLTKFSIEKID